MWLPMETAPLDGTWICIAAARIMRDGQPVRMTYTAHWAPTQISDGRDLWSWVDLAGRHALSASQWTYLENTA